MQVAGVMVRPGLIRVSCTYDRYYRGTSTVSSVSSVPSCSSTSHSLLESSTLSRVLRRHCCLVDIACHVTYWNRHAGCATQSEPHE